MEGRTKVTKDTLTEEGRFILANVLAEGRFSRNSTFEDLRSICENAVTLPFAEYVGFLVTEGYLLRTDGDGLEVTHKGSVVANGDSLSDFADRAVSYFKTRRKRSPKGKDEQRFSVTRSSGRMAATAVPVPAPLAPASSADGEIPSQGEIVDARYEKLASIGSGGIGTVYRARQVPLDREVALKEIRDLFDFMSDAQRPEILKRFTECVQAAAQLRHANILPLHDVNLDREFPYVVSELAPHGSARRLINDAEQIPISLALKYLLQTLHALRAAHADGVVHGGLKPENLLIDDYGNVKVSDFGFKRIVQRDDAASGQVYVGAGSVGYMAPELFRDPSAMGPQADIYALGIIFYELLTRKLPGRRSPLPSEIESRIPTSIDDIFDKMTRDAESERYETVDAILEDFDKVEGLGDLLGSKTQVPVSDNALEDITFRESADPETPIAAEQEVSSDDADTSADAAAATDDDSDADHVTSSAPKAATSSARRPLSYTQRVKKKRS